MENKSNPLYQVIIIGAGIAGLRTAQLLKKKGYNEILILETQNRVGGRTIGINYSNYSWDLGGQWVGPTQERIYNLLKELNIKTFPQNIKGKKAFILKNGIVKHYSGTIPPLPIIALIDVQLILWKLDSMIKKLPLDRNIDLWNLDECKEWDSMTLQTWYEKNMWTREGINIMNQAIRAILTVESKDVSFLYFMHYIRQSGSFNIYGSIMRLVEVSNGAQQDRIIGGAFNISNKLYELLKENIKLNEEVIKIEQKNDRIIVYTSNGNFYESQYVVLTIPPIVAGKINYEPSLPIIRNDIHYRFPMGKVIKCIAFYEDAFWKKKGFSGECVSQNDIITMGFEANSYDEKIFALVGFICGDYARYWSDQSIEKRKKEVLNFFSKCFGEEALNPIYYIDKDWCSDKWSFGGYTSVAPPGLLVEHGIALRQPIGRIHFAGTETARVWTGYIDGAIESAERVTQEIDYRLQGKVLTIKERINPSIIKNEKFSKWKFLLFPILLTLGVYSFKSIIKIDF